MMKLVTPKGELELPAEFSLTMERTNPLLSDQGDATVPATLPATPRNLSILGNRHRIDGAKVYDNMVEAILTAGPVQKKGRLVIDSVSRSEGIDASFAIDSSDLYTLAKEKTLKQLFEGQGETFQSVAAAATHLYGIYSTGNMQWPYNVAPVAVSPYTSDGSTRYQLNNEPASNGLVYAARTVRDGDKQVSVPEGYGLAPFFRLGAMLDLLFASLGYAVTGNIFTASPLNRIVLLHNCADCLCNPTHRLHYSDMVPSCTLSDFLDWLLAKFHCQPVVDSEARTVRIVRMEDMLATEPDADLTGKVEGHWKVLLQPSRRVVLKPSVTLAENDEAQEDQESLESLTRPAAQTMQDFMAKHGEYVEVDEDQFLSLGSAQPPVTCCTVLRKADGTFYACHINPYTGLQEVRPVGSNHFAYDRQNSDGSEEFEQADVIPAMLASRSLIQGAKKDAVPFIGERIHYHTAIDNAREDARQDIIAAQFRFSADFAALTTATTQGFIPYNTQTGGLELPWPLTNEGMYEPFWKGYNELLLNRAPHVAGRVLTDTHRLLAADMSVPKMADGQMLIPVSASGKVGERPVLAECEFIVNKRFSDGVTDPTYPPVAANGLKWDMQSNIGKLPEDLFDRDKASIEEEYEHDHSTQFTPHAVATYDRGSVVMQESGVSVGPPSFLGETRTATVKATVRVYFLVDITFEGLTDELHLAGARDYSDQDVTFTFVAVANP